MKIYIVLFITALQIFLVQSLKAQFTKGQIDQLTAAGIYDALEPENTFVRAKAEEVTEDFYESDYIYSVCSIFDYVYRGWNYSSDPGGMEYFERAGVSVYSMTGDCDDYAILMISMVKSLGGDGRIICVSGHAYPELYLGKNLTQSEIDMLQDKINSYYESKGSRIKLRYLNYHTDADNTSWLNLDYQDRYPGGRFIEYSPSAEHLVIYSDGSYRLAYLNSEN